MASVHKTDFLMSISFGTLNLLIKQLDAKKIVKVFITEYPFVIRQDYNKKEALIWRLYDLKYL